MRNVLLLLLAAVMQQESHAYMIAVVPKMRAAVGFYGLTEKGCKDKAAAMDNVTCVYTGSWQPNVTENIRIINELIDDPQIDAISLSVLDPVAYTPVINRGVALGKRKPACSAIVTFCFIVSSFAFELVIQESLSLPLTRMLPIAIASPMLALITTLWGANWPNCSGRSSLMAGLTVLFLLLDLTIWRSEYKGFEMDCPSQAGKKYRTPSRTAKKILILALTR
jgi:hypothetical protein